MVVMMWHPIPSSSSDHPLGSLDDLIATAYEAYVRPRLTSIFSNASNDGKKWELSEVFLNGHNLSSSEFEDEILKILVENPEGSYSEERLILEYLHKLFCAALSKDDPLIIQPILKSYSANQVKYINEKLQYLACSFVKETCGLASTCASTGRRVVGK